MARHIASLSYCSAVLACARRVCEASEPLLLILSPWSVISMQPAPAKSHHTKSSSCWNVAAQSPLDDRISAFAAGEGDRKPEIPQKECRKEFLKPITFTFLELCCAPINFSNKNSKKWFIFGSLDINKLDVQYNSRRCSITQSVKLGCQTCRFFFFLFTEAP